MKKYIPVIGDVVLYGDETPMVVVNMENYEYAGSCCYDRKYLLCEESFIKKNETIISDDEIENHGFWIEFRGRELPDIRKYEGTAPYAVEPVQCYSFRKKKAKTVIVYE